MDQSSGKSSLIKTFEKHAGRAKERFLQNLGKLDKTKDELFDEYTQNFNKQQKVAEKYQRELKNYVTCAKAIEASIQTLIETVSEIYECDWDKKQEINSSLEKLLKIQSFYNQKLQEDVLGSVNSYLNQFPEIKNKVAKRGRKLVDYDGARHSLESLSAHKKAGGKEEVKVLKAKEALEEARNNFEPLNTELMDELPALYSSRIPFYASNLQSLFSAEMSFHHDSSVIYSELSEIIEHLANEHRRGSYPTVSSSPIGGPRVLGAEPPPVTTPPATTPPVTTPSANTTTTTEEQNSTELNGETIATPPEDHTPAVRKHNSGDRKQTQQEEGTTEPPDNTSPKTTLPQQDVTPVPRGATLTNLPPGVLYRVRTTHRYQAEDADELTFEKDEIISVVEFDDPEDKDEGWLMGIHEPSMKKGVFPENFTKPI